MGSTYSVKYVRSEGVAPQAELKAATEAILAEIDLQMSTYRDDSLIEQFNRAPAGACQAMPKGVLDLVRAGDRLHQESQGYFDLTLEPLLNLWGFGPKGQGEAGLAYGMSPLRVFFRILVPQMIRLAIPGFTNNWLVLVKATALISLVGLQDMMARAKSAGDATREPFTYILLAAAVYLAITSVSLLVLRYLERRYSVGVKAAEL